MTDANQPKPPMWQQVINNQRFQMTLSAAIKASGFAALPIVQKYVPWVTPDGVASYLIAWAPFAVSTCIDWYRNHPDNILARAIKVINGGNASPAAVAKLAATVK